MERSGIAFCIGKEERLSVITVIEGRFGVDEQLAAEGGVDDRRSEQAGQFEMVFHGGGNRHGDRTVKILGS